MNRQKERPKEEATDTVKVNTHKKIRTQIHKSEKQMTGLNKK